MVISRYGRRQLLQPSPACRDSPKGAKRGASPRRTGSTHCNRPTPWPHRAVHRGRATGPGPPRRDNLYAHRRTQCIDQRGQRTTSQRIRAIHPTIHTRQRGHICQKEAERSASGAEIEIALAGVHVSKCRQQLAYRHNRASSRNSYASHRRDQV